jgi:hypothetical protein
MKEVPQFMMVYQTSPEGYFEYEEKVKLLIPPDEQTGALPLYAIPYLAVLVPVPDEIPGHRRKYVSPFGPFEIERRTKGEWIQEPKAIPTPPQEGAEVDQPPVDEN